MTPRSDEELRALLARAHEDDAPPALRAVLGRRPATRRRLWPVAALAAAAVAAVLLWPRPRPPEQLDLAWSAPLDFLLEVPGTDLLRDVPRFDLKGTLP